MCHDILKEEDDDVVVVAATSVQSSVNEDPNGNVTDSHDNGEEAPCAGTESNPDSPKISSTGTGTKTTNGNVANVANGNKPNNKKKGKKGAQNVKSGGDTEQITGDETKESSSPVTVVAEDTAVGIKG